MQTLLKQAKPFSKEAILNELSSLEISQTGLVVTTSHEDEIIKQATVSEKYHTFDFAEFMSSILDEATAAFTPESYKLKIVGGKQEISLIGEEVIINGDRFSRMLSILNSTDKSRALQMNMGLLRQVCTNGMFAAVPNEAVQVKGKHYKSTLPEKIEHFAQALPQFVHITNEQKDVISNLANKTISFRELAIRLAKNKDNEIVTSKLRKLTSLSNKLLTSDSDALVNISAESKQVLLRPELILNSNAVQDIDINAYQIMNCYTELFRSSDSSKQHRESKRITSIINAI